MVLVKICQFIHVFILGKIVEGNVFQDSLERKKTLFYTIKSTSLKYPQIGIFPKGLEHGFFQKLVLLSYYYFREKRPGKCVLRYSGEKKRLFRL